MEGSAALVCLIFATLNIITLSTEVNASSHLTVNLFSISFHPEIFHCQYYVFICIVSLD